MGANHETSTVLEPTDWCVCRQQEQRYVLYNSRTDELHLVTPFGFYLYRLCDGVHSIGEIQAAVASTGDDRDRAHDRIALFLDELIARGVLEVVDE